MQICQLWIGQRRQTQVNQVSNQKPTSQSQEGSQSIAQVTWQETDKPKKQLPAFHTIEYTMNINNFKLDSIWFSNLNPSIEINYPY